MLVSDKKRIGFLFGAGTSFATGVSTVSVPVIAPMTRQVAEQVSKGSAKFKTAVQEIEQECNDAGTGFNIETLLSSIEAKRRVLGKGKLNGLHSAAFGELAAAVKREIVALVSVHDLVKPAERRTLAHAKLANWIQKARRRFPTEIYTTNYDYLFELAMEAFSIPYFDGFAGSYEPFFCPEAVDDLTAYPRLVKLWKIHGSLGWVYRESERAVIRDRQSPDESLLIYPSHLKYDSSKKQPYIGLIDRLCAFLQQDDAVLFTCGYAFADSHINERIVTSLRRGANSHVIALYFDEVGGQVCRLADDRDPVRELAANETGGRLSAYGRRHAVIGGRFGEWRLRDRPSPIESGQIGRYFEGDESSETGGEGGWTGTGRLLLPDFVKLTEFLDDLSLPDESAAGGAVR